MDAFYFFILFFYLTATSQITANVFPCQNCVSTGLNTDQTDTTIAFKEVNTPACCSAFQFIKNLLWLQLKMTIL